MLIALFSLLFSLLLGGPEQIFMAPEVEKGVKKHIIDKEKRKEILIDLKEGKKTIKAFNKQNSAIAKDIEKEILDKNGSKEQIDALLDSSLKMRVNHQAEYVEMRLRIQKSMTEEEWEKVIVKASYPSDKDQKKDDKQDSKGKEGFNKLMDKIQNAIQSHVDQDEQRKNSLEAFAVFRSNYEELFDLKADLDYKNQAILRNQNAGKEELSAWYADQDELRKKVFSSFIEFLSDIKENTNDEEWNKLKKTVAAIFKGQ